MRVCHACGDFVLSLTMPSGAAAQWQVKVRKTVPGTGEAARFPAETLGTHTDGNTETQSD
jgi:hypothetical protein